MMKNPVYQIIDILKMIIKSLSIYPTIIDNILDGNFIQGLF